VDTDRKGSELEDVHLIEHGVDFEQ